MSKRIILSEDDECFPEKVAENENYFEEQENVVDSKNFQKRNICERTEKSKNSKFDFLSKFKN